QRFNTKPCGSGLARDSGGSACINAECAAVIANKLAPTGGLCLDMNLVFAEDQMWERACSRWRWFSVHHAECAAAFLSKPSPSKVTALQALHMSTRRPIESLTL